MIVNGLYILVFGHGMLLEPPGRSSRWRYNISAPINYDDNGIQCGGLTTQWMKFNGKCGICGDSYGDLRPRANEIGGYYGGEGIITHSYTHNEIVIFGVLITTNHLGYIYFEICNLDQYNFIESEECFKQKLIYTDGSDRFYVGTLEGFFHLQLKLPQNLYCQHCVLRWTYIAGNNWGICPNGTEALGCGPQEQFVNCADITILPSYEKYFYNIWRRVDKLLDIKLF